MQFSADTIMEGNLLDRALYAALIVVGMLILFQRRARVGELLGNNLAIVAFLLFAAISAVWSDYPLISLRRWTKLFGDLVMVLVLCSETVSVRALSVTIKRCAYILIPLSVLFCKYYEHLGRVFDSWGKASYTGVTLDKNMLGYLLFTFGLYFTSALIRRQVLRQQDPSRYRMELIIALLFAAMTGWLLTIANSKTATVSLAVGVAILLALRTEVFYRHFWKLTITAFLLAIGLDEVFSVKSAILEASGRDATFTGRTGLWETLLEEPVNPLLGAGYASFWLGERLTRYWAMYPNSPPIQAHNGYLEVYLNMGLVGLILLGFLLWNGLRTIQKRAAEAISSPDYDDRVQGMFGLAFGASYLLYNITEATFQGSNFLFTIFLLLAVDRRQKLTESSRAWRGTGRLWRRKRTIEQESAVRRSRAHQ